MLQDTEVTIVKFTNPHRFWIREKRNSKTLCGIEAELQKDLARAKHTQAVLNDMVAVDDGSTFKRAKVMQVRRIQYECELLDYPKNITVDCVYKLPEKYTKIPPMVHLAALCDIVGLEMVLNVETSDIDQTTSVHFTSSCIRHIEELLKRSTKTFFLAQYSANHILCGNVLLKIDSNVIDLASYLLEHNWATKNRKLFKQILGCSGDLNEVSPSVEDNVQGAEGVGRACSRIQRVMMTDKNDFVSEWISTLDSNPSVVEDYSDRNQSRLSFVQSMSDISNISQESNYSSQGITNTLTKKRNRLSTSDIVERLSQRKSHDTSSEISSLDSTSQAPCRLHLPANDLRKLMSEKRGRKESENKITKDHSTKQHTDIENHKVPSEPILAHVIKNSFSIKEVNKMSTQNRLKKLITEVDVAKTSHSPKPISSEQSKSGTTQSSEEITTLQTSEDSTSDTSTYYSDSKHTECKTSFKSNHPQKCIKLKKNIRKAKTDYSTTSIASSSENESNINDADTTSTSDVIQEETSDNEEFKGVVLKNNVHLFCKCASCIKWLDKDEDQVVFLGDETKPDIDLHRGTPQPFIKKKDDGNAQLIVYKGIRRKNTTKIEKDMAPSILIHGPGHIPTSMSDIKALPFCIQVHRALRECGIKKVYEMQMYIWPALMRSMNACIVNSSHTGKTMCYLPALVSFVIQKPERYPFLPKEPGPVSVILCDGVNKAEETYAILTRFLCCTRKRVNTYLLVPPINQSEFKHLKSADILVTTPKVFVRILTSRQINLKRLLHFIVEDIDLILERTMNEFYKLVHAIQTMLNHRVYVNSVQIVTTSTRWTKPLESFVKQLATPPLICIGSHLESVLYGKANIKMHFVKCEKKKVDIAAILKDDVHAMKTVIVCNNDHEVSELAEYLQGEGVSVLALTESLLREEIEEQEIMWMIAPDKKNSALICTDMLLHTQLSVTTARILIHYSLPEASWSAFARRFKTVLDAHDSPYNPKFSKANACHVHIFVDEDCNKQFPRLYYFLKQLGTSLPEKFTQFCKQREESEEQEKVNTLQRLCKYLKLLGKCNKFRCKKRHMFSPELDVSPDIPKSGHIKFKLLHIQDVTHYSVQLFEHTDTDWNVRAIANYDKFVRSDLKIAVESNKLMAINVVEGNQYAYFDAENVIYRRCKVLRIISVHNITNNAHEVKVKFIDDGLVKNIFASLLYELPTEYIEFPPQSIDARLVNIVPLEGDTKWNHRAKSKVEKILKDFLERYPDCYCSGTIVLQVGGTVYLNDLKIEQYLPGVEETVTLLDIKKKLVGMDIVDVDETVLPNLRDICVKSGLELPNYYIKPPSKQIIKVAQIKPTWAFMDCKPDVYNQVYFSCGVTPDKFYVRLAKYDDLFVSLQEEIQEAVLKPFYPEIKEIVPGNCYLAKNPDEDGYGRVIVRSIEDDIVDCFFVDFGDGAKVNKNTMKFLSDELIHKLPFQAIECSLYGITSVLEEWPIDAINILYNHTLIPDTDIYRDLHANVMRTEVSTFGNTKYVIILVDNLTESMIVLNKIIVDCGFARDKSDERLEDVMLPEIKIQIGETQDEEEDDSVTPCIQVHKMDDDIDLPDDFNLDIEASLLEGDGYDCYIQDFPTFMKEISKQKLTTTVQNQATCSKETDAASEGASYVPMKALPPVKHRTPNVLWHQDNQFVKLEIFVSGIKDYQLHILRLRNLVFQSSVNNKDYKLNFNLYDSVSSNIQHNTNGVTVRVIMTKKNEGEWPRLTSTKEKQRNIKYDLTKLKLDDEKKKRRFLELDDGLEDEETDDEFGPTYLVQGSDTDDSADSVCYDDIG